MLILEATFLLHILFVNLMVGGSLFTWVFEGLGARRKSAAFDRVAPAAKYRIPTPVSRRYLIE